MSKCSLRKICALRYSSLWNSITYMIHLCNLKNNGNKQIDWNYWICSCFNGFSCCLYPYYIWQLWQCVGLGCIVMKGLSQHVLALSSHQQLCAYITDASRQPRWLALLWTFYWYVLLQKLKRAVNYNIMLEAQPKPLHLPFCRQLMLT